MGRIRCEKAPQVVRACAFLMLFISGVVESMEYVAFGVDESDCPLPCETYSTETKLSTSAKSDEYGVGFIINLPQHIEVSAELGLMLFSKAQLYRLLQPRL